MTTHIVLGGTGAVGRATIETLTDHGVRPVSVSRTPSPSTSGQESRQADLRDAAKTKAAVEGADVVHLTASPPYSTKEWRRQWPIITANVIDACIAADAPLVFLDNVYAYGPVDGPMTEDTPYQPTTRKGLIRHELLRMLDQGATRGLRFSIVRSADFYGPNVATSVFTGMVVENLAAGKAPVWMFDARPLHSMTYVPDLGRAMATVGTRLLEGAPNGRVWHAPTAPALNGQDYANLAAAAFSKSSGAAHVRPLRTMSMSMTRLGGLFVPPAREAIELAYQNTSDYVFDSSRFEAEFGIAPTFYAEGIAATVDATQAQRTAQVT